MGLGEPPTPDTTYLAAEEMGKHTTALKVPDDNEASAVANEDLVGVTGVLLQSFHHLEHPPVAGLLWQPRQGNAVSPCKMVGPVTSTVRVMLNKTWYLYILKHTHTQQKTLAGGRYDSNHYNSKT